MFNNPFDFELPEQLIKMIVEMETESTPLNKDLYQDEIRSMAHGYTDTYFTEEQAEEIIDYYCRCR